MRLREVQWILRATVPLLEVSEKERRNTGGALQVTIQLVGRLQRALEQLGKLTVFAQVTKEILKGVAFLSAYDQVEISQGDFNVLSQRISALREQAHGLLRLVDQLLDAEEPASFAYFLPPLQHKTLKSAAERMLTIDQIFGVTLQRLVATELRVVGLEAGSDVVVLELVGQVGKVALLVGAVSGTIVAAKPALNLVARIYGGAKDVVAFTLEMAEKLEKLRKLKLENQHLESQVKVHVAAAEANLQDIAGDIAAKSRAEFVGPQENPHLLIQRSVARLAEEIKAGATLQFPANTPQSVAEVLESAGAADALAPANTRNPAPEDAPLALLPAPEEDTDVLASDGTVGDAEKPEPSS